MKEIIRIIHIYDCQIIVKHTQFQIKSLVVECMWLFNLIFSVFYTLKLLQTFTCMSLTCIILMFTK